MLYQEHRPAAPLDAAIEMFWYCEGYQAAHPKERILPSGTFQLVIELAHGYIRQWDRTPGATRYFDDSAALMVGARSEYSVIDTAGLTAMAGVKFRPGGASAFLEVPAHEFWNRDVPLEQIWGRQARALRDRLAEAPGAAGKFAVLEAAFRERLRAPFALRPSVALGLKTFGSTPAWRSVLDVAGEAGLSRRRFAQVFREQVGLTPKLYCRLLRFQAVVAQTRRGQQVNWAGVAQAGGYCDQAHLAHEFREFAGISPGAYASSPHFWRSHVAIA